MEDNFQRAREFSKKVAESHQACIESSITEAYRRGYSDGQHAVEERARAILDSRKEDGPKQMDRDATKDAALRSPAPLSLQKRLELASELNQLRRLAQFPDNVESSNAGCSSHAPEGWCEDCRPNAGCTCTDLLNGHHSDCGRNSP